MKNPFFFCILVLLAFNYNQAFATRSKRDQHAISKAYMQFVNGQVVQVLGIAEEIYHIDIYGPKNRMGHPTLLMQIPLWNPNSYPDRPGFYTARGSNYHFDPNVPVMRFLNGQIGQISRVLQELDALTIFGINNVILKKIFFLRTNPSRIHPSVYPHPYDFRANSDHIQMMHHSASGYPQGYPHHISVQFNHPMDAQYRQYVNANNGCNNFEQSGSVMLCENGIKAPVYQVWRYSDGVVILGYPDGNGNMPILYANIGNFQGRDTHGEPSQFRQQQQNTYNVNLNQFERTDASESKTSKLNPFAKDFLAKPENDDEQLNLENDPPTSGETTGEHDEQIEGKVNHEAILDEAHVTADDLSDNSSDPTFQQMKPTRRKVSRKAPEELFSSAPDVSESNMYAQIAVEETPSATAIELSPQETLMTTPVMNPQKGSNKKTIKKKQQPKTVKTKSQQRKALKSPEKCPLSCRKRTDLWQTVKKMAILCLLLCGGLYALLANTPNTDVSNLMPFNDRPAMRSNRQYVLPNKQQECKKGSCANIIDMNMSSEEIRVLERNILEKTNLSFDKSAQTPSMYKLVLEDLDGKLEVFMRCFDRICDTPSARKSIFREIKNEILTQLTETSDEEAVASLPFRIGLSSIPGYKTFGYFNLNFEEKRIHAYSIVARASSLQ